MTNDNRNKEHLNRVSRSFALCISELKSPLRDWVTLAYLLCRLIDTIEDSKWPKLDQQLNSFSTFKKFILSPPEKSQVEAWKSDVPQDIPQGEKLLVIDTYEILQELHQLKETAKSEIQRIAICMLEGMQHFCEQNRDATDLRLQSETQLNQYCFFVAGILGEMLTSLVNQAYGHSEVSHRQLVDGVHFGLFLQKINIFKDQQTDEKEGRFFLPKRQLSRQQLAKNAEHAFSYFESIPLQYKDYRIFCGWSFYLGLLSIEVIDRSWEEKRPHKVSRVTALAYLAKVKLYVDQPKALKEMYEDLSAKIQVRKSEDLAISPLSKEKASSEDWYKKIYTGTLSDQDFFELGLRNS